jgi:glycosyltransferase involved in cell wall biosynthesis
MKVLHVYAGNLYGGIETMLSALAAHRRLCPGLEPHFALCWEGRLSRELRAAGAPVHVLGEVRRSRPWTVLRARRRLRRLIARERFDVVVCQAVWSLAVFGPAVRRTGAPLVFWQHDVAAGASAPERAARKTPPDFAICNSRFTQSTIAAIFTGVPSAVLYCPVPLPPPGLDQDRARVRAEMQTAPGDVVVVQTSRMEAWKGHATHLRALAALRDVPGWTGWMLGGAQRPHEAAYVDGLKAEAARLGIGARVRFPGERTDVARVLAAADVLCQPNAGPEPFGIAFVEAMDAGLPVVTVAQGGALEVVDLSTGILIPPGDAPALADSLRCLVSDPALRARLGAAGRVRARELCDPGTQIRRLHDLLAEVVDRKRAG